MSVATAGARRRERRNWAVGELRATTGEAGKRMLVGHAAVYDRASDPIGGYFVEIVRPGAFRATLAAGADVRCLFNHDPSLVLGRTRSRTLRLFDEPRGLRMECDVPDVTHARDLLTLVDRGDVDQMSFSFVTVQDRWTFSRKDGELPVRELLEVELYDVSPVTYPAYPDTDLSARAAGAADAQAVLAAALARYEAGGPDILRRIAIEEADLA